jgi:hypothetical protein
MTIADLDLRKQVIEEIHARFHYGRDATVAAIRRVGLSWPGISAEVGEHCNSCRACTTSRAAPRGVGPTILETNSRVGPYHTLHMDIMMARYRASNGEQAALIIIDRFTSFVFGFAVGTTSSSASTNALRFLFAHMGCPHQLVSDNGPENKGHLAAFLQECGVVHVRATPYNKTGNSICERAIEDVRATMRKLVDGEDEHWVPRLYTAVRAHNARPTAFLGISPAEALLARRVDLGPPFTPAVRSDGIPTPSETIQILDKINQWRADSQMDVAFAAGRDEQRRMERFHAAEDEGRNDLTIKPGDWVLVRKDTRHKTDRHSEWPPRLVGSIRDGTYTLLFPDQIHADTKRKFKTQQLIPYTGRELPEPTFYVRGIPEAKYDPRDRSRLLYRTQWHDFLDPKFDTWEPEENLPHGKAIRAMMESARNRFMGKTRKN